MIGTDVHSVIICDDVRREQNGKDILIGVYSGDILVQNFPFILPLSMWMEYAPPKSGPNDIFIRIHYGQQPPSLVKATVEVIDSSTVGIPLSGFVIQGDKPDDLVVEYSADGTTFTVVKRKLVKQAPPGLTALTSVLPAPPSHNL
jgi:hypothetical protein